MRCQQCGHDLGPDARFCPSCGQPVTGVAAPAPHHLAWINNFIRDVASLSVRDLARVDRAHAVEIIKSPVFRLLCLVAVVPLAIQTLEGVQAILNGLAIWSGLLWALLLYRLFAHRQVPVGWAIGTLFFTAFVGVPLLRASLEVPVDVFSRLTSIDFLPLQLVGFIVGVGVREELFKAIPLLILIKLTPRMKNPVAGIVLGMMSGVGFAVAENVVYVFANLNRAVGAVQQTGQLIHLVGPVYTNVVRMAMTPFFHGCLSGIFGYFTSLSAANPAQRWPLLVAGWGMAAVLHGLFDTFVTRSPLWGVLVEGATFFLLMTYILKARGLTAASQLGGGLFGPEPEPPPA